MDPVVHFEMPFEDRKRLSSFYKSAFGWKMEGMGEPMDFPGIGKYVSFLDTEGNRVSVLQPAPMGKPAKAKPAARKKAAKRKR